MAACGEPSEAPLWALVAGLRALGIDGDTITRLLVKAADAPITTPDGAINQLLERAPPAEKAILHNIKNRTLPPDATAAISPGLYIDESDIDTFDRALAWLQDNQVFDEVTYER